MCKHQKSLDSDIPLDESYWIERIEELAAQGQRVLAMAMKPANSQKMELLFSDVERNLVMLGMFGMIDPPREEAINAVEACKKSRNSCKNDYR
jgi:magnesium-transporting ATPase (P-type)